MYKTIFSIVALLILGSCSPRLTPFTSGLMQDLQWTTEDLRRIQYYLAEDVILERTVRENKSEIVVGEIIMKDGKKTDRLVFRQGTPGVLVREINRDKLAIGFDKNNPDRFLVFTPHPKRNGVFVLSAQNWQDGRGQVTYGGNTYFTVPGSGLASLSVKIKGTRSNNTTTRDIEGRTVR